MNIIRLVFTDFKGQLSFILLCKLDKSPYLWLMFGTHYDRCYNLLAMIIYNSNHLLYAVFLMFHYPARCSIPVLLLLLPLNHTIVVI